MIVDKVGKVALSTEISLNPHSTCSALKKKRKEPKLKTFMSFLSGMKFTNKMHRILHDLKKSL